MRAWAKAREQVAELSAADLCAILWHQHEIKDFDKIARLTRFQIVGILSRPVDDKGRVELWGEPGSQQRRTKSTTDGPEGTDYYSICRYVYRKRLEKQGFPAHQIEAEIERLWQENPHVRGVTSIHAATIE